MSGGSAVKTAVGLRGITRLGSDHRERKTGRRPTAPAGLGLDRQGAAGPALKGKEISRRLAANLHARDRNRMAETRSGMG